MHIGFSYIGALMLVLLFVPNLFWIRLQPQDYAQYAGRERRLCRLLERVGQVLVTCLVLIFSDFNLGQPFPWALWLAAAGLAMALYEVHWIRYFRSQRTMRDFYRSLLGIPVAGAVLPVLAFMLLAVYGKNPFLFGAAFLLGVGHIGIHLEHSREAADI
jgi:hypothetical protein